METEELQVNKPHHKSKSGKKVNDKKRSLVDLENSKHRNPKAFVPSSLKKARDRTIRRAVVVERRLHVPLVDHSKRAVPPPFIVAVQGPPGVGKSTLIQSLVKHYVNKNLKLVKGPITVLTNRKRRVTFFEVPNDLGAMVDIGKIADLAILVVDGSYGFEMETFEFLNIMQTHGFPRVLGVITHLDKFKNMTLAQKTRKSLRLRFDVEIAKNSRIFTMSAIKYGRYEKKDVMNLARYISYQKSRPLIWRNSHPYVLVDRLMDFTPPEKIKEDKCVNRTVVFYGYMHGPNLKPDMALHIPGVGDFNSSQISLLEDPCPLPKKDTATRSVFKDRVLYAPMSDVGLVMYDQDAVYVELNRDPIYQPVGTGSNVVPVPEGSVGEEMIRNLYANKHTIEDALNSTKFQLFSNSNSIGHDDWHEPNDYSDKGEDNYDSSAEDSEGKNEICDEESYYKHDEPYQSVEYHRSNPRRLVESLTKKNDDHAVSFDDSFSESDISEASYVSSEGEEDMSSSEEDPFESHKEVDNTKLKAKCNSKTRKTIGVEKQIYEPEGCKNEHLPDSAFKSVISDNRMESITNNFVTEDDIQAFPLEYKNDANLMQVLKERFSNEKDILDNGSEEAEDDWEDLEGQEEVESEPHSDTDENIDWGALKAADKLKFDEAFDRAKSEGKKFELPALPSQSMTQSEDVTATSNEMTFYDKKKAEFETRAQENETAFLGLSDQLKTKFQGYHSGQYIKVIIENLPAELVENFDSHFPLILGGLMPAEQSLGMIQVRIKKHRWYSKVLKTNDPVIFSLGWRRFQSLPIYSLEDKNRNRMLKYTPEYMHCLATFYGPVAPPGSGLVAFQTTQNTVPYFRIIASGLVVNLDKSHEILKKLKLRGVPFKIKGLNAFIQGMFNSRLEVAKFHKAAIRTVSGIRGQVGKPVRDKDGAFRGRFEDKLKMSDIVFLKTWYPVKPKAFYNPMTSILLKDKSSWTGVRPVGLLRKIYGVHAPVNEDSKYREIKRTNEDLPPLLRIPNRLLKVLPFKELPIYEKSNPALVKKEKRSTKIRIVDPAEKKKMKLVQDLLLLRNDALEIQKKKRLQRAKQYREKKEKELAEAQRHIKEHRNNVYRTRGGKPLKGGH